MMVRKDVYSDGLWQWRFVATLEMARRACCGNIPMEMISHGTKKEMRWEMTLAHLLGTIRNQEEHARNIKTWFFSFASCMVLHNIELKHPFLGCYPTF